MTVMESWTVIRAGRRLNRLKQFLSLLGILVTTVVFASSLLFTIGPSTKCGLMGHAFLCEFFNPANKEQPLHANGHEQALDTLNQVDDYSILHPELHIFRAVKSLHLKWNITMRNEAPDGVLRPIYLINGQFPGPTLEARSGDELIVDVTNMVQDQTNEGLSIHWHGLNLKGFNRMDGAVGVSQTAITTGKTFRYRFRIGEDEYGTFWYHGHAGVQRADGLYGGLVVHKPKEDSGRTSRSLMKDTDLQMERLFLVGDWHHQPANEVMEWFMNANHYGYEPAPDSMLINGRGSYNCSKAVAARPVTCKQILGPSIKIPSLVPVKLRIINTGSSSGFTLAFSSACIRLVSVDGGSKVSETAPWSDSVGVLYPGERMDIDIVLPSENESKMTIVLDQENMKLTNYALTPTQEFSITPTQDESTVADLKWISKHSSSCHARHFDLFQADGVEADSAADAAASIVGSRILYTKMGVEARRKIPLGVVNHTSWIVTNPLGDPLLDLSPEVWPQVVQTSNNLQNFVVPQLPLMDTLSFIDLLICNLDDTGHPFHLHGNSFRVMAVKQYDIETASFLLSANLSSSSELYKPHPLRKDTVYVPANGIAVLRVPLDNAGLWLLHCHILWHQQAGMGIVLQVGEYADFLHKEAISERNE